MGIQSVGENWNLWCDFSFYHGSVSGIRAKSELGLSGHAVMKLASTLPDVTFKKVQSTQGLQ